MKIAKLITLFVALSFSLQPIAYGFTVMRDFSHTHDTSYDVECGKWNGDGDYYTDAFKTVCEAGYMRGESAESFGGTSQLSRAAAAVIAGRVVMGFNDYENDGLNGNFYRSELRAWFTDVPPNEWWNEWILKAMYHAYDEHVMKGDGASTPTTFRPTYPINAAEFLKVVYEAAKQGNVLNEDFEQDMNYDSIVWYSGLVLVLRDAGVIDNYDLNESKFISFKFHYRASRGDEETYHTYRLDLDKPINRQDAAALIHEMLFHDLIESVNE